MRKITIFFLLIIIMNSFAFSKYYWEDQNWHEDFLKIVFEKDFENFLQKEYPPKNRAELWLKFVKDVIKMNLDKAFRKGIAELESNDKTKCFAEKIKNSFGKISALQVTLLMDDYIYLKGQKLLATGTSKEMAPGVFAGYIELGNVVGNILNPDHFDAPCMEGVLFHELLHALPEIYDETIAYSCANFAFLCAPLGNNKISDCDCKDEKKHRQRKSKKSGCIDDEDNFYNPGKDTPDDNFSFYTGNFVTVNDNINALIYKNAFFKEMDALIGGLYFEGATSPEKLSDVSKVMAIPSSAFFGQSNNSTLTVMLKEYVQKGNSLIIFTQQYGKDIKNIIPTDEGGIGSIIGYREDSSCLKNSVYLQEMHPILSSSTNGILDVGIDGYASVNTGSNATVLLRRIRNNEPALLYYKYGMGTIYLYFGFTDYACSKSMAGTQEIKLVKNMLRHALDPDANIPMFNLEDNPNPLINLNIRVTNHSETPAAKAKISVYTIENTLLYETETAVNLNQGDYTDIPISFTLPDLASKDYGIGFTVFELTDTDGNPCQLKTETPSGRFSIYKLITPANINDRLYQWFTVDDEVVFWGDEIECTIHFKNTTDQVRQVEIKDPYFLINHGYKQIPFNSFSATVNPGETYEHVVYLPTNEISLMGNDSVTFRINYYDAAGQVRQLGAAKLVYVKKALTKSSVTMNKPYSLDPGGPVNYSINSFANASIAGETTIKLVLERYTRENMAYSEIQTLFQGTHDFSTGGDFKYDGSYTPETIYPRGEYRLKLQVTAPNDVKELTRYQDFYYEQSGFKVTPGSVKPLRWLVPGETYTIPVYATNVSSNNDYHVTNGRCILRLLSPAGQEIYRKEITNINIAGEAQLDLTQTFVFNPVETGDYSLEYAYEDETFNDNLRFRKAQVLYYCPSFSVTPDKPAYDYMDTANMEVKANGLGSYTIQCQCPETGFTETRIVQIPDPTITDRDKVLYETEQSLSIAPAQETIISLSFA